MQANSSRFMAVALLFSVSPLWGQDAASKVQEGNIDQWIEYYQRAREEQRPRVHERAGEGASAPDEKRAPEPPGSGDADRDCSAGSDC